jgi:hypothetical protein
MSDERRGAAASRLAAGGWFVLCLVLATTAVGRAETVTLEPVKDNTLFEDQEGLLSNGEGRHLYAGRVSFQNLGLVRRALIAFDVAASVPAGATITGAMLGLDMSMTISEDQDMSLHRVLADWGEGMSEAPVDRGGGGVPAAQGDATWIHTFFDGEQWASPGGDFDAMPSATTPVGSPATYTWGSTDAIVADVQAWLDEPQTNFGWILIGNEASFGTAKRFESRESAAESRPRLTIDFELSTTPTPTETATGGSTEPPTPTPTETLADTATATPTDTPTDTPTMLPTDTPTGTPTDTRTATPADTATATPTDTPTVTPTPTGSPTPPARRCVGDCDADGSVALAEVVFGVRIALGLAPLLECPGLDANDDERTDIVELVEAVDSSFDCAPACPLPNPAGCKQTGCPPGFVCDLTVGCEPSSCFCEEDGGVWICTEDCGGGTCVSEEEPRKPIGT